MRSLCIVLGCLAIFFGGCGSKLIVPPHRNQSDFEFRYAQFQFADLEPRADREKVNVAIVESIDAIGGLYVDLAVFVRRDRYPRVEESELASIASSVAGVLEDNPHRWLVARDTSGKKIRLSSPTTRPGGYWFPLIIPPYMPEYVLKGPSVRVQRGEYDVVIQTVRLAKPWNATDCTCTFTDAIETDPPSSWSSRQFHYHR